MVYYNPCLPDSVVFVPVYNPTNPGFDQCSYFNKIFVWKKSSWEAPSARQSGFYEMFVLYDDFCSTFCQILHLFHHSFFRSVPKKVARILPNQTHLPSHCSSLLQSLVHGCHRYLAKGTTLPPGFRRPPHVRTMRRPFWRDLQHLKKGACKHVEYVCMYIYIYIYIYM